MFVEILKVAIRATTAGLAGCAVLAVSAAAGINIVPALLAASATTLTVLRMV